MSDMLRVFSVVLGTGFTDAALEIRKKAVRNEINTLIPSVKYLINFMLQESVEAESDHLVLAYDLTEVKQLTLDFADGKQQKMSVLVRMLNEAHKLRVSAEHSQIRIGELANLISGISTDFDSNAIELPELDHINEQLRQLMYTKRGSASRINFPDEDVICQFPELASFRLESGTRIIRARVVNISANKSELTSVIEIKTGDDQLVGKTLPKKIGLNRPTDSVRAKQWPLIYAALDNKLIVEAEVRVALRAENQTPAYLELVRIVNTGSLRTIFDSWLSEVETIRR